MKSYTITFTLDQLQTVAAGLNELPRKHSQPIIDVIQLQMTEAEQKEKEAEQKERLTEKPASELTKDDLKVIAEAQKTEPKLKVIEGGKEDPAPGRGTDPDGGAA